MKTTKLSLRIVLVFLVAMAISLIPDTFPTLFGDWYCSGSVHFSGAHNAYECMYNGPHNPTRHWGYRHWLLFLMGVTLFIVQIVSIVNSKDEKS